MRAQIWRLFCDAYDYESSQMFTPQLHLNNNLGLGRAGRDDGSEGPSFGISHLISAIRRQAKPFGACCIAGVALGAAYLMIAKPLYTASANIMIDNRQLRSIRDISTLSDSSALDYNPEVESQVEVLRSEQISLAVVKNLNLSTDAAFSDPPTSLIDRPKVWLDQVVAAVASKISGTKDKPQRSEGADPGRLKELKALDRLTRNLKISRVGRTFVLQLDFTSSDPALAAKIVNEYTKSYMSEQLNTRVGDTRRARAWLQQRTEELRQSSITADLAAQKFKADNNLLTAKGELISEQQFNEMTTQLVADRATTAQAQARYMRIKEIIDTHQTESAVTESLNDPILTELRTKYLDASKRYSELSRKLTPDHVVLVNLKHSMDELGAQLFQELGRIAQAYRADYEVAAAHEKALTSNLSSQQSVAVTANDAQAQLRQLEQKAESLKTLYQSFLQRYQEAAQQESFPMTDVHIISAATEPLSPSHPSKPLVLVASLALGALVGAGVGLLGESMDRVFRTVTQVREELGADVLGLLPLLDDESVPSAVQETIAPIMRYVIDHPFSAYAETLRSTKVTADIALQNRSPKIIGMVSLLPQEGKSTVAKNFASMLALQGAKTLLIDADTRNPALTRAMLGKRTEGSQSESSVAPALGDVLRYERDSGLHILPCLYAKDDPRIAHGFSSATLHTLLQDVNHSFDYVVIDLPPMGPVVNARAMASAIDAFVFVVAWGKTSRGAVRSALTKEHSIRDKLLGVILNKVDVKKLKIYEHFDSDGYYHQHYSKYYEHTEGS
jgi:succinoglycan biosynthesis transport protein ExoP